MKFRVSLGQVSTSTEKEENLERGRELIKAAAEERADLLVLPELFMAYTTLDEPPKRFAELAEDVDGPFVSAMGLEAKKRGIHVILGIIERSPKSAKVRNTAVMLSPEGRVVAAHRKMQQFDSFGYRESSRFEPGTQVDRPVKTRLGKIGLMTCYELRFPEIARILALEGADLIVVPTAWVAGRMKEDHLHILARARALENTVFVAVASQTGKIFSGRSLVVDPFGVPICDAGEDEGLVTAEVDTDRIRRVRRLLPNLGQIRKDIYKKY